MDRRFHQAWGALLQAGRPFTVATVVRTYGSSSAKTGAKALIDDTGRNRFGWVGGGCAERHVCAEAVRALTEGRPRTISVALDDQVLGVGMPCGGTMEVYLEPHRKRPRLVVAGHDDGAVAIAELAAWVGYQTTVWAPDPPAGLAGLAVVAAPYHELAVTPGSRVVVVTRQTSDLDALRRASLGNPGYVGLVAKRARAQETLDALRAEGAATGAVDRIRSPAGLPIGSRSPAEITLSIVAAIVMHDHDGSGLPMLTVKTGIEPGQRQPARAGLDTLELVVVGQGRTAEALAWLGLWLKR